MKKIFIIGAQGQIGSELTTKLRKKYGHKHVICSDVRMPSHDVLNDLAPFERLDVTNIERIAQVVKKYKIDTIYHLPAILSAVAEEKPQIAWNIGINGLYNVLEVARESKCAVFFPSSIGAFGPTTPPDNTPQDVIQRPDTMYGVTKVTGELLCDYYYKRFGVDTRGVRFPGIISHVTLPGGGTTDYAVEIFYEAIKHQKYHCPLKAGTFLDMMYMPDALNAAISIMEADPSKLIHRNGFNITAMSFEPETIAAEIRKHIPGFKMEYHNDPIRQAIADTWPNSMDDSCAREEWGWSPEFDLEKMTIDMLDKVAVKLK